MSIPGSLRPARSLVLAGVLLSAALSGGALGAQEPSSIPSIEERERRVEELRGAAPLELAVAMRELAEALAYHARHEEAIEAASEAVRLSELTADTAEVALAFNQLGLYHWNVARYDSAAANLGRARDLWTLVDNRVRLGMVYNNIGTTHYQWGNYELALSSFLRALEYREEVGDERGQALVLTNVGRTYHDWSQFVRARESFEEAIRIADAIEDPFVQGYARHNLATLHSTLGEWDRAEELYRASLGYYQSRSGMISPSDALGGWALNMLGIGMVHVGRGDPEAAIPILREVLDVARELEHPRREARAQLDLGRAYRSAGRLDLAAEHLEAGLVVAREWDQRPLALEMLAELADVHELRGAPELALEHLRAHIALGDTVFDQGAVQRIASMEARAEADRQERENLLLREEQRVREVVITRQRTIALLGAGLLLLAALLVAVLIHFNRRGREREIELAGANRELRDALSEVRTLKGLIPICTHCKKVRDDEGYWESVEGYVAARSEAHFSHSICSECGPEAYGEDWPAAD